MIRQKKSSLSDKENFHQMRLYTERNKNNGKEKIRV